LFIFNDLTAISFRRFSRMRRFDQKRFRRIPRGERALQTLSGPDTEAEDDRRRPSGLWKDSTLGLAITQSDRIANIFGNWEFLL
jgi:hypothetical protein